MLNEKKHLPNGFYSIYGNPECGNKLANRTRTPWRVYCDFNSEPGYVWTLIESFALNWKSLVTRGFSYNQHFPTVPEYSHWQLYRLQLDQMKQLVQIDHSLTCKSMWRATCNFNSRTLPYSSKPVDYMRSYFNRTDILSEGYLGCSYMDYLNIRGYWIEKRSVLLIGDRNRHTHLRGTKSCQYNDYFPETTVGETNFGLYNNINTKFTCTSHLNDTTNWWIGGKVDDML
ncbi:uncharacterized protein TRIADDRAFT_59530 [Trichoplax adhaerens]|uniref:Fibrinogen C-terminal domain-containing protein n=1 Tax=Trichoplax adhaerens TaxID=10228 RepID=B3S5W4_TRIAD|nr:predicted protein [Trichoplax adhaerens]EDV21877.1 predicted protein [Trichoplax adhaerens]|eukprot:XP_002115514.1 predicted protein [Trichoplax adhaerens]